MSALLDVLRSHPVAQVALVAPGRDPLTYGELVERVADQAARLPGRLVLVLPNGLDLAVAVLGAIAGGGCAPLAVDAPEAQYRRELAVLRPDAVLVESGDDGPACAAATGACVPVVRVGDGASVPAGGRTDRAALLLFTSGSTAAPKLVGLAEASLLASAANVAATLRLGPDDRCLDLMPLSHIHGIVAGLLAPLVSGGSVVCTPGFRAPDVIDWVGSLRPTWYTAVPTIHQAMLDVYRDRPAKDLFRLVRSSSSALPRRVLTELESVFGAPAVEAYGMTEAAHQIASNPLPPAVRKPGTVGLPTGVEVMILEGGEIGLRGPTITGYVDNDDANAAAFVDGWFRTGDLGTIDDDGFVTITGRSKEMVNRGGEKVAPREVDDALLEHEDVVQAAAFAAPHPRLGEEVAAAVVLGPAATVTAAQLRVFVAERLAPYKVPRKIVVVDAIPKGRTGKLDRRGLPAALGLDRLPDAGAAALPSGPLEQELAELWQEVLDLDEPPDVTADFFDLGGDSLHATELLDCAGTRYGRTLDATIFFTGATVRGMAAAVAAPTSSSSRVRAVAVQPEGSRAPLFCLLRGGALVSVRHFSAALGADQPVYGLWSPWMHGGPAIAGAVEDIAAECLGAIRAVRPTGPYRLFGYSLGGVVMYDVARQLTDAGETVDVLVLADTPHPSISRRSYARRTTPAYRARKLLSRRGPSIVDFRIRRAIGRPRPTPVVYVPGSDVPIDWTAAMARERAYEPGPAHWPVAILCTAGYRRLADAEDLGWSQVLTPAQVRPVPGNHSSMLGEPYVHVLSAELGACLKSIS